MQGKPLKHYLWETHQSSTLLSRRTVVTSPWARGHRHRTLPGSPSTQLGPLPQLSHQDMTRVIDAAHQWLHL